MVGWHYRLDEHEFVQALGVDDGQGGLACCSPWGHKESDTTERLNWTVVSLSVQKLISLIRYHLFIFAFISVALGDWPKKTLLQFTSENVLLMFSSRSFMALCLMFKFLRHFELIFVYGMRVCSNFISLCVTVQLFQYHWPKRLSILTSFVKGYPTVGVVWAT